MTRILVTGAAGFIGFHLSQLLLDQGHEVFGLDGLTKYYDVRLKKDRLAVLQEQSNFRFMETRIENCDGVAKAFSEGKPEVVVHLAAQAGVRYSVEDPRSYVETNLVGTFNVMEEARQANVRHLLMASSSSVYGANSKLPFVETDPTDTPLSMYAATKKANEAMGNAYAYTHKIPITMFRFFTVYGPWGRPDMALFKFTSAILKGDPIQVYNDGKMFRDFTYVADLVESIQLLIDCVPEGSEPKEGSGLASPPFRVLNIGCSDKVPLMDFISALEEKLNKKAVVDFQPLQVGDVLATHADTSRLKELTGFRPRTNYRDGIGYFVDWYKDYYGVS